MSLDSHFPVINTDAQRAADLRAVRTHDQLTRTREIDRYELAQNVASRLLENFEGGTEATARLMEAHKAEMQEFDGAAQ